MKIHVLDISRIELEQQLASGESFAATAVGRQIEKIAPFVILCPWSFDASDTPFLGQLVRLASDCGTSIIAGGASGLVGCASFGAQPDPHDWTAPGGADSEAFDELRRASESAHLGLTAPRFLLRLPYGPESDPIETFPFEELPGGNPHEGYLWGSGAFLCGYQLIHAFTGEGWEMDLGRISGGIGGLPVHSFAAGGDTEVKPCAEAWLTDRAADAILARGLMPVLSVRGSDSALLVSLRSISDPASPLRFGS